jgi:probable F420-dependent oxidoreductase
MSLQTGKRSINFGPMALDFANPRGPGIRELLSIVARIETLGYDGMWSAENAGTDVFSLLAAAAPATERLKLGTHIVPIFGRAPSVIAMHAATINGLSAGRLKLGLGASTRPVVEKWRGETFEKPLQRMREYLDIITALLAGEKVTLHGQTTSITDCRLLIDLPDPPPIYLAAVGPKMLSLAGQLADGVLIGMVTPEGMREAIDSVSVGATSAGRRLEDLDIAASLSVIVREDPGQARTFAARHAAFYLSVEDPYQRTLIRQGYGDEIAVFKSYWDAGDRRGALEHMPQRLLDAVVVSGTPNEVNARLDDMTGEQKFSSLVLYPIVAEDSADKTLEQLVFTLEALAPKVSAPLGRRL